MTGIHNTSMCHVGMNREAMKEAVLQKLAIGQQYRLKSMHAAKGDVPKPAICTLMEFSQNVVVFKHKNNTLESFTYQEIWTQMASGDFI